jgi:hypothetical protein
MLHFGIREKHRKIRPLLPELPHVLWLDASDSGAQLDALLALRPFPNPPAAGTVLVPGRYAGRFAARQVVTYGLSPDDALTLSSVGEGRMVAALQRELVTLTGRTLEPQEFLVPDAGGREASLALSCALLTAGLPPEQLLLFSSKTEVFSE